MKLALIASLLAFPAAVAQAQQPPVPPAHPAPAPKPAPAPNVSKSWDFNFDYQPSVEVDLSELNDMKWEAMAMADQARDQARWALGTADMQALQNDAMDRARDALQRTKLNLDAVNWSFGGGESFAHSPRAPWAQGDPADSLYRLARQAFNDGDWRRASDVFHDIVQKYPRSAYAPDCAYYEAFSRYRIGTTEELHQALALLTDQTSASSRSSMRADAAGLAARIRGALAARGDQQAAAQVAQDAQKAGSCDREDMSVRAEALNALGQMDPAQATPLLERVLQRKDTCSTQLKRSALFMLVRRGDSTATNALITVATNNDEDDNLRSDAISYLGRMPGDAPFATLESLVKSSTDDRIQRAAVRALAQNGTPRARQALRTLIERNDVSEALRSEAIGDFTADPASPDDAAYLRGLYPKLPSERLKVADLRALAHAGGSDNEQFLLGVARNTSESSEVRGAAINYAGRDPSVSIADLGKLYDDSESRNVREQIIGVLGRRNEPEAADKLMDIAKNGTDPDTRRQAISVLSRQTNDPRVTKFLTELVGR